MKLAIYIYKNLFISISKCLFFGFSIFFIFSLINNLGEDSDFFSIINLSFLNSLQIFSYIPGFIFLISIILFIINLNIRNELLIIKEYLSNLKILFFLIPIILIISVIELNKDFLIDEIDIKKTNLVNSSNDKNDKLIVRYKNNEKTFTLLSGFNINQNKLDEFHNFISNNDEIISGRYINEINFNNDKFFSEYFFQYNQNKILKEDKKVVINKSNYDFLNHNRIYYFKNKKNGVFEKKASMILLSTIFIFIIIFFINFNSNQNKSYNFNMTGFLISIFLLIYGNIFKNLNLQQFDHLFQLTVTVTIFIIMLKSIKNA